MKKRQIVSIVNFIRDVEPRGPVDLAESVLKQIELMKKHGLRGSFLLQYDALIDPVYTDLLKSLDPAQFELGVWFEIVEPQCEAANIPWTGRFPWDWHVHCGFSVGYTKPQREALADVLFGKFREVFGYYPRVFGSWLFDSHTACYISGKYDIDAMLICKEQYGTDGYTLWGGYYGQAYYPSRENVFMPAQTKDEQIQVPLFRMLGSDPVYQYDFGMSAENGASRVQGVITLEPVYFGAGGGAPAWVDWFMKENFNGDCLTFGFTQAGQENSFGWPRMQGGIEYQFAQFEKLAAEGKIVVEPVGETGKWFKKTWDTTPASAITAHTAFDDNDKNSIWYSTKNYRINLYSDHGDFRIRDIHVFDEHFKDPFEDKVCLANEAAYETLPVADGNRHTGNGVIAGVRVMRNGKPVKAGEMKFTEIREGEARADYGSFSVLLREDSFTFTSDGDFELKYMYGRDDDHMETVVNYSENELVMSFEGRTYGLKLEKGAFVSPSEVRSEKGAVECVIER
ncbi:MAG: hypothetical protein K6B54_03465 [Clostridia bacterium]|nr:hypothetical protein [Clostridia bacterium]